MRNYTPIEIFKTALVRSANENHIELTESEVSKLAKDNILSWDYKSYAWEDNITNVVARVLEKEKSLKKGA